MISCCFLPYYHGVTCTYFLWLKHSVEWQYITKVGMKVASSILFLTNCNYSYLETYIYHKYILYKIDIIFPQSLLRFQHTFSSGAWDDVCWSNEASEILTHAVSAGRHPKNGVFGVHTSGSKKMEVEGC
jgi:hypothetical protein